MANKVENEPTVLAPDQNHSHSGDETETSTVVDAHPSLIHGYDDDNDLEAARVCWIALFLVHRDCYHG